MPGPTQAVDIRGSPDICETSIGTHAFKPAHELNPAPAIDDGVRTIVMVPIRPPQDLLAGY